MSTSIRQHNYKSDYLDLASPSQPAHKVAENSDFLKADKLKNTECSSCKKIFVKYIAPIVSYEAIYNKLLSPIRYSVYNMPVVREFVRSAMKCPFLNAVKVPFEQLSFLAYDTMKMDYYNDSDQLTCVIGPITEELLIRNLLQEQILKKIPSIMLSKINKNYAEKFDKSLLIRILRVVMSSLIFANYHNSPRSYVWVDCFIGGLFFGGLQEIIGSTLPSIAAHIAHNTLEAYNIVNPLGNY